MADRTLAVTLRQAAPIPLDVSFTCARGEVLAIFGPSGSGKTTILRSIAGLYRPETAAIRVGSALWTDTRTNIFTPAHLRAVGFVFQDYALFPHLTALVLLVFSFAMLVAVYGLRRRPWATAPMA